MAFNYFDILPDNILIEIFNKTANQIEKDIERVYFIVRFCEEITDNTEVWSDDEDYKNIDWINDPIWDTWISDYDK